MNNRIKQLREDSINAIEHISAERAILITEYLENNSINPDSKIIERARIFDYILSNKHLYIGTNELIVGERGEKPKATSTYPEICLHSIKDLEILNSREKVSFKVSDEVKDIYKKKIIPFWEGKSNREKIMKKMSKEWHSAYSAGIFTEFQEQRAPGHTVLGPKMFKKGFKDILKEVYDKKESLDKNEIDYKKKIDFLEAEIISINAIIKYAKRYSKQLKLIAEEEKDAKRKLELEEMSLICNKVPENAPETIHEALQHYWFIHLGVITELNPWDSFNPGRLDQHLLPLYLNDIEKGRINNNKMHELLSCFWIKFNNQPAPPKVGVTALESNTYTDFCLINIGGLDKDGNDAVNQVSYILLDIIKDLRILQPSSMIQVSKKNPDAFIEKALEIIETGFGQPSIFNTDTIIEQMLAQGKDIVDARNGGASGCVETGAFGTERYILTGYINLLKVLELTLNSGFDPICGDMIGIKTDNLENITTFDKLLENFYKQLEYFIEIKIKGNNIIEEIFEENLCVPFLSSLIEGCIENAKDYNQGGAKYNTSYIQGVGLGSITDSLTAIKYHVYDNDNIELNEYLSVLNSNFENNTKLRYNLIYNTPKYGNDDNYADSRAVEVFNMFHQLVDNKKSRFGRYRINLLPTTSHIYFGTKTGASADGRKAFETISEGISPVQGADINGPTAVIKSASKIDHKKTGGTLLNQKFNPSIFKQNNAKQKITSLIRTYFMLGGHHIQFNVINANTLRLAQKEPHKYKDLIVRVAGYSDYFNDLNTKLQNEIISRTEHK